MSHPFRSLAGMRRSTPSPPPPDCQHALHSHGHFGLVACEDCGLVEWFGPTGPIDPAEAIAGLFGSYELIGPVPAVGAPARSVLAYRPARARRAALDILPLQRWLAASPDVWVATDGQALLLATSNDLMVHNLTRGA